MISDRLKQADKARKQLYAAACRHTRMDNTVVVLVLLFISSAIRSCRVPATVHIV